jgi:5'(3')-deoxyribonucleotidase
VADFVRRRVLDYDEYWFDLDEYQVDGQQRLFAHLGFTKFSPSIMKRVLSEWKLFRQIVTADIYAIRDDGDVDKWEHFVSLLGFVPTGTTILCNNGNYRQLYIHRVANEHFQTDHHEPISDRPVDATGSRPDRSVQ